MRGNLTNIFPILFIAWSAGNPRPSAAGSINEMSKNIESLSGEMTYGTAVTVKTQTYIK